MLRLMRLSEICRGFPVEVRRDAEIASLGLVEIPLEYRFVFVLSEPLLGKGREIGGVAAVLTGQDLAGRVGNEFGLVVSEDPRRTFVELHNRLSSTEFYASPGPTKIDSSAQVHPGAIVSPIGVVIEQHSMVGAGAIIEPHTSIAEDVRIMPGAVLGSDGFQTMKFKDAMIDLRHAGGLEVGPRSVIMANAVLARAVFRQSTRIGADCRIGNGAFVSHNVQIGDRTLVGHGAVVAGNCTIGTDVTIGPGAICLDRLHIGDGAYVTAGAVVTKSIGKGERVSGNFAIRHDQHIEFVKLISADHRE